MPGEETKIGQPLALPFPTALVTALEGYVAVHRPVLAVLRGRCGRLAGLAADALASVRRRQSEVDEAKLACLQARESTAGPPFCSPLPLPRH